MSKNNPTPQSIYQKSKQPITLITELIIGLILSAASFVIFILITNFVIDKKEMSLDHTLSILIYNLRSPLLTSFMNSLSFLGGQLLFTLSILCLLYLIFKKFYKESLFLFITFVGGFLLNLFIKYLYQIPRPTIDPLYTENFYSFPSGHSMNSFIFLTTICYLIYHLTKNKKITIIASSIAIIFILLIGFSRIYLGVHYPTDVIAGFIAGFFWFATMIVVHKTYQFYKYHKLLKKQHPK